jgi:hypothetical protein
LIQRERLANKICDCRRRTLDLSIFDDIAREGLEPPLQDETAFAYLNRSGRNEAVHVRQLVDDWLDRYPKAHRESLIQRFRSPIDDAHRSAFFELFLHELLLANGHRIVAIEPNLAHTPRSPDFLVQSKQRGRFYLEAVLATGRSQEEAAAQRRLNQALRAIDSVNSPAHFLDLTVRGTPARPISINRLRRELNTWIAVLPDDEQAREAAPFVYEEHGVQIRLEAFPKHNRQRRGRAIGARHFPVQQVTANEDIRAALEKKASRYGALDLPYIVAVNAFGLFLDEDDAFDALLGTPAVVVRRMADGTMKPEETRNPDGVWCGSKGARKLGLSAVFSTQQIDPWNFASRNARIIRNPWAQKALGPVSLGVDEFNPVGNKFRKTEGRNMGLIFGLPDGWPEY